MHHVFWPRHFHFVLSKKVTVGEPERDGRLRRPRTMSKAIHQVPLLVGLECENFWVGLKGVLEQDGGVRVASVRHELIGDVRNMIKTERDRQTETDRDRQRHRQKHRQRDRQRQRQTARQNQPQTERERQAKRMTRRNKTPKRHHNSCQRECKFNQAWGLITRASASRRMALVTQKLTLCRKKGAQLPSCVAGDALQAKERIPGSAVPPEPGVTTQGMRFRVCQTGSAYGYWEGRINTELMHHEREDTRTLRARWRCSSTQRFDPLESKLLTPLCSLLGHFLILVAMEHRQRVEKQLGS